MSSNNTTAGHQVTRSTGNTAQHEVKMKPEECTEESKAMELSDDIDEDLSKAYKYVEQEATTGMENVGLVPNTEEGGQRIVRHLEEKKEKFESIRNKLESDIVDKAKESVKPLKPEEKVHKSSYLDTVVTWAKHELKEFDKSIKAIMSNLASLIVGIHKYIGNNIIIRILCGTSGVALGGGLVKAGSLAAMGLVLNAAVIGGISLVVAGGLLWISSRHFGKISIPWFVCGVAVGAIGGSYLVANSTTAGATSETTAAAINADFAITAIKADYALNADFAMAALNARFATLAII